MTQVDFYLLPEQQHNPLPFACRLLEKIYGLGRRVYVMTTDEQQAKALDELLWRHRPGSFVPHGLAGSCDHEQTNILIGSTESDGPHHEVLFNLQSEVSLSFSRYERLVEVVVPREPDQELARQRYRFYRERGYPLNNHRVSN